MTEGGWLPTGANQSSKDSSRIILQDTRSSAAPISEATPASTKNSFAPESATMSARLSAVEEGASGATATPARSAPMNSVA